MKKKLSEDEEDKKYERKQIIKEMKKKLSEDEEDRMN